LQAGDGGNEPHTCDEPECKTPSRRFPGLMCLSAAKSYTVDKEKDELLAAVLLLGVRILVPNLFGACNCICNELHSSC